MIEFIKAFLPVFLYVFIIVDPMASIPLFLSLTKDYSEKKMKNAATKAALIAVVLALIFIFLGQKVLDLMHITLQDFKIAGGIVLILLGLESVLSFSIGREEKNKSNKLETISVLIATPMLTGPGLMTALIILTQEQGILVSISASLSALFVAWLALFNANFLRKILGQQIIEISSKVFGLLVLALGISFIKSGLGLF